MKSIATDKAPNAIGPYSQAIAIGNQIFTSGQIPLDPATGKLVEGSFDDKVRRVFENLKAVLAAGGADFRHVVKTTVFITDFANFPALNAIYAEYMGDHKPARSTVAVAGLPMGSPVEIEMIAVVE